MGKLTPDQIAQAKRLYDEGVSTPQIALGFGVERDTILRAIDPEWAAFRREQINAARQFKKRNPTIKRVSTGRPVNNVPTQFKPTEAEYRHALSLIPPDTRDLTARLMGDPLPNDLRRKDKATMTIKCASCGRFIPYSEMGQEGPAVFHFTPDSDRSTEESEWICGRCNTQEIKEPARFGNHGSPPLENVASTALNDS